MNREEALFCLVFTGSNKEGFVMSEACLTPLQEQLIRMCFIDRDESIRIYYFCEDVASVFRVSLRAVRKLVGSLVAEQKQSTYKTIRSRYRHKKKAPVRFRARLQPLCCRRN